MYRVPYLFEIFLNIFLVFFNPIRIQLELDSDLDPDPNPNDNVGGSETLIITLKEKCTQKGYLVNSVGGRRVHNQCT